MQCENVFCIYWDKDCCILDDISLDISGSCQCCIYVDISETLLREKRKNTIIKTEDYYISESSDE